MFNLNGRKLEFIRPLGEGGQADVFLVFDHRPNRARALKVLRDDRDPGQRVMFKREVARHLRCLDAGLVNIFDYELDVSAPWVLMEWCRRGSLRDRLEDLREEGYVHAPMHALQEARELARAVAVLHRRGVLHRDLKPGNVLIDSLGRLRVNDLGHGVTVGPFGLRHSAHAYGTPLYRPPELDRGVAIPATDVWGIGVILYEMVMGFPMPRDPAAIVWPGEVYPGTPPALDEVLRAFTSADPAGRPADGQAALALLDHAMLDAYRWAWWHPSAEGVWGA